MKGYFYLLCILFLSNAAIRVLQIVGGVPAVLVVSYVADLTLFVLCLRVCYGLAFNKRYFEAGPVRLIYFGTMGLGVLSVLLRGFGDQLGLPIVTTGLLDLALWFLNYALFAGPAVILEKAMKEDG